MGEVTSTYRDLYMAVHPILVIRSRQGARKLYSAEVPSDSGKAASATSSFTSRAADSRCSQPT